MEHTKGEWDITENIPNGLVCCKEHIEVATKKWSICAVFTDINEGVKEAQANAKLIAASPDMLEFIARMVGESNFIDEQDKQEAINLINKATK